MIKLRRDGWIGWETVGVAEILVSHLVGEITLHCDTVCESVH